MSRARLTAWVLALAAGAAIVALLAGALLAAAFGPADPEPEFRTTVRTFGDRTITVTVTDPADGPAPSDGRAATLRWTAVALAVVLPVVAGATWLLAGRNLRPLAARAAEVEARGRDQEHLLGDVVHELRTPLAVAATNLDLVRTDADLAGSLASRVDAVRRAVDRMSRTVDDLAVHGRLVVTGRPGAPVDLAAEVRDLAAEHAGPAAARGLRVDAVAPEPVPVRADRAALRTAVANLLANALRLAPGGSTIAVAVGRHLDWAFVAVRDEGPGIDPADHESVFRRHWRGRYETDRDRPDATSPAPRGLGLTIARQAVEAQGGRVTVASTPGVGSTFVVWLPATADADPGLIVADDGVHHRFDPVGS